jgi:hypothetical protein
LWAAAVGDGVLALEFPEDELDFGKKRNHEKAAQDALGAGAALDGVEVALRGAGAGTAAAAA